MGYFSFPFPFPSPLVYEAKLEFLEREGGILEKKFLQQGMYGYFMEYWVEDKVECLSNVPDDFLIYSTPLQAHNTRSIIMFLTVDETLMCYD